LISHDLAVVAALCDRVAVLYAGRIMEKGPVGQVLHTPQHPYTQVLLEALPRPDSRGKPLHSIWAPVPRSQGLLKGCPFRSRCPSSTEACLKEQLMRQVASSHWAACHLKGATTEL
jgi:oligopeptide/dipeptide ABC transporter ATP-binding protein